MFTVGTITFLLSLQVTSIFSSSAFQTVWKDGIAQGQPSSEKEHVFEGQLAEGSDIILIMICRTLHHAEGSVKVNVQWTLTEMECQEDWHNTSLGQIITEVGMSQKTGKQHKTMYVQQGMTQTFECPSSETMYTLKDESDEPYFKSGVYHQKESNFFIKKIHRKHLVQNQTRENRITRTWEAGIYRLHVKVTPKEKDLKGPQFGALIVVKMPGPFGFLPAIQFPLLPFNGVMALLHLVMASVWIFLWIKHFKQTVPFHLMLGVITVAAAIGYVFQFIDLIQMNVNGEGRFTVMWAASFLSSIQGGLFAALLMAVSIGYGFSRPTLSWSLIGIIASLCTFKFSTQVAWFIIDNIDARYKLRQPWLTRTCLIFQFIVLLIIGGWIVIGGIVTLCTLIKRQHAKKLTVFLVYCVAACVTFLCLLVTGVLSFLPQANLMCSQTLWRFAWIPHGSWSMSSLILLTVVMYMWKPGDMDRYYAFQPLVDQEQQEEEEAEEKIEKIKLEEI